MARAIAQPRWATKRTDRPTYAPIIAKVSSLLGWTLKDWQMQKWVEPAAEYFPDTGQFAYHTIIVTAPRQTGKTTVSLPWSTARCFSFGMDQRVFCTMQDRQNMTRKLVKDHMPVFERSALREDIDYNLRKTNGSEAIEFPRTSSYIAVASIGADANHGGSVDQVNIDEAFAHRSNAIEEGFGPAMSARTMLPHKGPQTLIFSTKGDDNSVYLNKKIAIGRRAVEQGLTEGIFYLEYAAPDDADIYDENVWWENHPGLGDLTSAAYLRNKLEECEDDDDLHDWARGYLNISKPGNVRESPIDLDQWEKMGNLESSIVGPIALAIDRPRDLSRTVIAAAGLNEEGLEHVEIIADKDGESWVIDWLDGVRRRNGTNDIALDPAGAAGAMIGKLESNDWNVHTFAGQKLKQACGAFLDSALADNLAHLSQPVLKQAVNDVRKKTVGDSWRWAAKEPGCYISPVYAVTIALALTHKLATQASEPFESVYSGGSGMIDLDNY